MRLLTAIHAKISANDKSLDSLPKLREFAQKQGWKIVCDYIDKLRANDTATHASADAIVGVVTAMAKQEHIRISRRVKAGIARRQAKGQRWGPPRIEVDMHSVNARRKAGESLRSIARDLGVSPSLLVKLSKARS